MIALERRLYGIVLRLHPATFRHEFAREMALDFEDALHTYGAARLWMDVLRSLVRQWASRLVSVGCEPAAATSTPSLLAGQYVMIGEEALTPLELARGFFASVAILSLWAFAQQFGPSHVPGLLAVYASSGASPSAPETRQVERSSVASATGIGSLNSDLKPAVRIQVSSASVSAGGASAGERRLAFEVVSIRRNNAASGPPQFGPTPDGFHLIGLPLFAIFQMAYAPPDESGPLRGDRIAGAPDWVKGAERYDVVAKVGEADLADWQKPELRRTMLPAMLQTMLAERFGVVAHRETKEMQVYDLVVAKGGPKFKPAETVDAAELRQKHPRGGMMTGGGMAVQGPNGTQFYGISMAMLGQTELSTAAGRPVVDKTGLTGRYDLALPSWGLPPLPPGTSQPGSSPPLPEAAQPLTSPALQPEGGESIFTVLPEALGLRLVPAKGQVETLVIDRVERPTEN